MDRDDFSVARVSAVDLKSRRRSDVSIGLAPVPDVVDCDLPRNRVDTIDNPVLSDSQAKQVLGTGEFQSASRFGFLP